MCGFILCRLKVVKPYFETQLSGNSILSRTNVYFTLFRTFSLSQCLLLTIIEILPLRKREYGSSYELFKSTRSSALMLYQKYVHVVLAGLMERVPSLDRQLWICSTLSSVICIKYKESNQMGNYLHVYSPVWDLLWVFIICETIKSWR